MTESDRVETHFSVGVETPEVEDYRPISPWVIAACVASVASLLAMAHPMFWVLPAVALILSGWAIARVSSPDSRYSGRRGAVVALSLAAVIGGYAPARGLSRSRALYDLAQSKSEAWISLVQQERLLEAHQLTLTPGERFQGPGPLADHYLPPPPPVVTDPDSMDPLDMPLGPAPSDKLAGFQNEEVVKKLIGLGEQASITHVQDVSIQTVYEGVKVTQRFQATGAGSGEPESFEFLIRATRQEAPEHAIWYVGELEEVQ